MNYANKTFSVPLKYLKNVKRITATIILSLKLMQVSVFMKKKFKKYLAEFCSESYFVSNILYYFKIFDYNSDSHMNNILPFRK